MVLQCGEFAVHGCFGPRADFGKTGVAEEGSRRDRRTLSPYFRLEILGSERGKQCTVSPYVSTNSAQSTTLKLANVRR
jgi:hypothetical protein